MADDRQLYFDQLGEAFDQYMDAYDVQRRLVLVFEDLLRSHSLRDKSVLEVGCGTGIFSGRVRDAGGRLTVLDIGPNLVTTVSRAMDCEGVQGDVCRLPFSDGAFEAVISSECIEHTPAPEQALRELCRVCRAGGVICVTSPNRLWHPLVTLAGRLRIRSFSGMENWISPRRAVAILRDEAMAGITVSGCHLLPFQLKPLRPLLRAADRMGRTLYPAMINWGIMATKPAANGAQTTVHAT